MPQGTKTMEVAFEGMRKDIEHIKESMDLFVASYKSMDERVKALENWKLLCSTFIKVPE